MDRTSRFPLACPTLTSKRLWSAPLRDCDRQDGREPLEDVQEFRSGRMQQRSARPHGVELLLIGGLLEAQLVDLGTRPGAGLRDHLTTGVHAHDGKAELGEVLLGTAEGRRTPDEITLFKSLGLAIEDPVAAGHVLERAEREGVGTDVAFGGAHPSA